MAAPLDSKEVVSFEELLMSLGVSQDALIRLLVEKGVFSKEEFLEMVKTVHRERKKAEKSRGIPPPSPIDKNY